MAEPTFSVIVPAYNSEARIEGVLASVLAQTREDLELVVVDDGSTDRTAAAVERVASGDRRAGLIRQPNRGTVLARNAGLEAARGRFVSFLDDDDLWLPDYLARVGAALETDPELGLAHCDAWVLDARSGLVGRATALERQAGRLRRLPPRLDSEAALRALLRVNFITTCTATVRASALGSVGGLDPAIAGCDDWDLWLRIAASGAALARVEGAPVVQRRRPDSVSSDRLLMAKGSRLALEAALRRGIDDPAAARIARRHREAISREIGALESGSRLKTAIYGALRRLGRKRALRRRGDRRPPPEVAALLGRSARPTVAVDS